MSYVLNYIYLVIKYLFVSRLLDAGYSVSRNVESCRWKVATVIHVVVQTLFTVLIFYHRATTLAPVVLIEITCLLAGTWIEHRANGFATIKAYFVSEGFMVIGYVTIVAFFLHHP